MSVFEILSPQNVVLDLSARDRNDAIARLVDLLAAGDEIADAEKVRRAVMARERTRTTGVGGGLAIPHGKSPAVNRLAMAVGRCDPPLDFESIDGKPVELIVLLVSRADQTGPHIQALARISRLFSVAAVRKRLAAADTPQQFCDIVYEEEKADAPM